MKKKAQKAQPVSLKRKIMIYGGLFVAGAAIGRFSLPARIETKIETQIVEKEVVKKERDKQTDKVTIVTETTSPDGTITKKTEIVDKTKTTTEVNKQKDTDASSSESKVVEYAKNEWFIRVLAKGNVSSPGPLHYGLGVDRRIIGPFYLGVYGYDDKTVGGSVGLSF